MNLNELNLLLSSGAIKVSFEEMHQGQKDAFRLILESEGVDVPKKLPCTFIKCKDKKEASQNKTYPCIGNGEKLCQVEIMRWAKPHQSKIQKQY